MTPDRVSREVTIYDIAREAGVSPSTVSRTFARPGLVKVATARKVIATAEALGYRGSAGAQDRPLTGHRVIAVVLADIANPYCTAVARGVQQVAARHGYTTQLTESLSSADCERQILERLHDVDGLVLVSPLVSEGPILAAARARPVVLVNRIVRGLPCVIADNVTGARRAVEHLVAAGHRRIVYVAGPADSWVGGLRWRAIREQAAQLGATVRRTSHHEATFEGGALAAPELVGRPHAGVLVHNDVMAIGLIHGLRSAGEAVPARHCVVGFDDAPVAGMLSPSLTSVAAPLDAMAASATSLLVDAIKGRTSRDGVRIVPCRLVLRDSTVRHVVDAERAAAASGAGALAVPAPRVHPGGPHRRGPSA